MGTAKEPAPVKVFTGLLASESDLLRGVESDLVALLGPVDQRSDILPWNFSSFYASEMGAGLMRGFISFEPLHSPANLAAIKAATQSIESRHRNALGGRRVNVDPGYIDAHKLVLASTKNAGQRIYLTQGIYAEATLLFDNGSFHGLEYTYRDYLIPEALEFFSALRIRYLAQLRQRC